MDCPDGNSEVKKEKGAAFAAVLVRLYKDRCLLLSAFGAVPLLLPLPLLLLLILMLL